MNSKSFFIVLCVLCLALGGCAPPMRPPTAAPNRLIPLRFLTPVSGEVYTASQRILLTASARLTQSSVSRVAFLANGAVIALANPADIRNFYSTTWSPPVPGEYYIQAQVTIQDGSSAISEPHRICVMPFTGTTDYGPWLLGEYTGPCALPTQIRNHAAVGDVGLRVVVSPAALLFPSPGCSAPLPSIAFTATVDDPQDVVVFSYALLVHGDSNNPNHPDYAPGWMNWITTRSGNQKEYRRTIQLTDAFAGGIDTGTGEIRWSVDLYGRDGRRLRGEGGLMPAELIGCTQRPLQIGLSPTPTTQVLHLAPSETPSLTPEPLAPPRFTFNKNAFCRKGPDTSFPDVTAIASGDTVDILNVSEDGFWYYVFWKQFNAKCWVAASTGLATGNTTDLKVLVGPELPKPGLPPETPPAPGSEPAPVPCNPLIRTCP